MNSNPKNGKTNVVLQWSGPQSIVAREAFEIGDGGKVFALTSSGPIYISAVMDYRHLGARWASCGRLGPEVGSKAVAIGQMTRSYGKRVLSNDALQVERRTWLLVFVCRLGYERQDVGPVCP